MSWLSSPRSTRDPSISWVTREEGHRLPGRQNSPGLVRKLVLVEPGGALDAKFEPSRLPKNPPIALGPLYAQAAERIRRGEIDEGLALIVDVTHGPGGWAKLPENGRQRRRDNAPTLIGQMREERAPFSRGDAEAILLPPTLLMAGERSPESFHRILDGLESALKDVRRVIIPDASHSRTLHNPRVFNREALAFLEDR